MATEENIICIMDQYGDGTTYIEFVEYNYQEKRYIKAIRRVPRKNKASVLFNMPDYAAKNMAKTILENC